MNRRTLLAGMAVGATGLAGCFGSDGGDSEDGSDGSTEDDGSTTEEGSGGSAPDPEPTIESSQLTTVSTECMGSGGGGVTADREGGSVTVEGTARASTPCHRAMLGGAGIESDRLVVDVELRDEDRMCTQCIGAINYEASFDVANADALAGVTVRHGEDEHTAEFE